MDIKILEGSKRTYVEQAGFRILNGMYYVVFRSGDKEHTFVLPLPAAKALSRGIAKHIEDFEKKHNIEIPSHLSNEPLPSPIQMKSDDKK